MNDHTEMLEMYFRLMNLNGASHVYRTSLHSGVLDALSSGSMSAADVAAACGIVEGPTLLLLRTLESMGIVRSDDAGFTLTPLTQILLQGGYRELGDEYWAHLPKLLDTGKPMVRMDDSAESEKHYRSQAQALGWMLGPAADAAAEALEIGQTLKAPAILDVGAGSAIWSLTMARRDPGATVTAVDWPAVLEVAVATARRFGLEDRLTTITGNYHEVRYPETSFDLALLGNVTHLESPEGNRSLMIKIRAALNPGGRIVIFDVFPGQPRGDLNRTLYALGLALRTEAGCVYSPEELGRLLGEAGFESPRLVNLPVPPYAEGMLVSARPTE
jgi:2-polyprenyl-3-methyl-5-hydroxy-6-metoxy-1,4-benzoquinol methylase